MRAMRRILLGAGALMAVHLQAASAQEAPSDGTGFSFAAYGNSRPMMYLPFKEGQPEVQELFREIFGLVLPEKVAAEVVKKYVKATYDPVTKELIQIDMPFDTFSEHTRLTVDQGWVTEASVEDVKLLPGVRRTMFRLAGGDWVAREIVGDVQAGRARFVINSGDVVWWGNQGRTVADSPYWQRVNRTMLERLPPPDDEMRAAGLDGRWFIGVGNHEVWGDPKIDGVLSTVPYLKQARGDAGESHLQVRLQRRPLYLPVERQVRLPLALAMGRRPAEICGADAADAAVAGRGQGAGHRQGVHHLPLPGVRPVRHGPDPRPRQSPQGDCVLRQGHGNHRVQRARAHHRDLRGRRREVPDAGRRRRRAGPDPPGPDEVQGPGRLSAGSLLAGRAAEGGVQLRPGRRQPGQETKFTLKRFRPWAAEPFGTVELYK